MTSTDTNQATLPKRKNKLTFNDLKVNNYALQEMFLTRVQNVETGEINFIGFLKGKTFYVSKTYFNFFGGGLSLHQTPKDSFIANRVLNKLNLEDLETMKKVTSLVSDFLPSGTREIRSDDGEDFVDSKEIDWKQNFQDFFDLKSFYTYKKSTSKTNPTYYTKFPALSEVPVKKTSKRSIKTQTLRLLVDINPRQQLAPLFNLNGDLDLFNTGFDRPTNITPLEDRVGKGVKRNNFVRGSNGSYKVLKFKLTGIKPFGQNFDNTTYPQSLLAKEFQINLYKILTNLQSNELYGLGVTKKAWVDFFVRPQYYGITNLEIEKKDGSGWTYPFKTTQSSWDKKAEYFLAGLPAFTWMALFYVLDKSEQYLQDEKLKLSVNKLFVALKISKSTEINHTTFKFMDVKQLLEVNKALSAFDLSGVLPEFKLNLTGSLVHVIVPYKNVQLVENSAFNGVFKVTDPTLGTMKHLYDFTGEYGGQYKTKDYNETTYYMTFELRGSEFKYLFNYPIQSNAIKWNKETKKHEVESSTLDNVITKMYNLYGDFIQRSVEPKEFRLSIIPNYDVYDDDAVYVYLDPRLPQISEKTSFVGIREVKHSQDFSSESTQVKEIQESTHFSNQSQVQVQPKESSEMSSPTVPNQSPEVVEEDDWSLDDLLST